MSNERIKIICCILIMGIILLCWGIQLPYTKAWETGALEIFAQNHLRYGFVLTKAVPVVNLIYGTPNYYRSHPILVPLLITLTFKMFGIHEWSARLVPIIFSLLELLFFYLLIEFISDRRTALFSSIIMVFLPMFNYYGRIVNYESVTLGIAMLFLYFFFKVVYTQKKTYLVPLFIIALLGMMSDWPFLLIFPALLLVALHKRGSLKIYLTLFLLALTVSVAIILYFNRVTGVSAIAQFHYFLNHCQYRDILSDGSFYQVLAKRLILNFTPVGCLFLLAWVFMVLRKKLIGSEKVNLVAMMLLIFGCSVVCIAPQAAYIHVWALQYLAPAIALITALGMLQLKKQLKVLCLSVFVTLSLLYFAKLHLVRFDGCYEAAKLLPAAASPKHILYTNTVSPVNFYSSLESHYFSFGMKQEGDPKDFIENKSPAYVCFIMYAHEPMFNHAELTELLVRKRYKIIYNQKEIELWLRYNDSFN